LTREFSLRTRRRVVGVVAPHPEAKRALTKSEPGRG
jgi:hypothetical protein